jgi:hypothetical protein
MEIFLSNHKPSSAAGIMASEAGVAGSLALQFGCPIDVLRKAMMRDGRGRASGPLGHALDQIADDEQSRQPAAWEPSNRVVAGIAGREQLGADSKTYQEAIAKADDEAARVLTFRCDTPATGAAPTCPIPPIGCGSNWTLTGPVPRNCS